jgi:PAS domain S-box-containing protein
LKGFSGISRDVTEEAWMEYEISSKRVFFESVLNNSIDGIIIADIDGNIKFLNEKAEAIFGHDIGEMKGKNISELLSTPKSPFVPGAFFAALERNGDSILFENVLFRRKIGTPVNVMLSSSIVRNESRDAIGFTAVLREIPVEDKNSEKPELPDSLINAILQSE